MNILKKYLKKYLKKFLPQNVRKYFIRKVTLHDVTPYDERLSLTLTLRNFTNINHIYAVLSNNGDTYELPYRLHSQTLVIDVPYEIIKYNTNVATINLQVNRKKMVISQASTFNFAKSSFIINGRLLNITGTGKLKLNHLFPEYFFSEETIKVENVSTSYNYLSFNFKNIENLTDFKIVFLYNHKIIEFDNISDQEHHCSISNFEDINMGRAHVYAVKNSVLYPIIFEKNTQFDTPFYHIDLFAKNKYLVADIHIHTLNMAQFDSKIEDGEIKITFKSRNNIKFHSFIVVDTLTQKTVSYLVKRQIDDSYTTCLPIEVLVDTFSRKRFILYTEEPYPIYIQPSIKHLETYGFSEKVRVLFQHEMIKIWFYQRKDELAGFKVTRPKVRRIITAIDHTTIEGYVSGLEEFVDCSPYLVFEERYTSERIRIAIDDIFKINLKEIDFLSIKSKDKTIIDIFIEIVHSDGETIRKGKIKYQFSDYKKDNYYSRNEFTDEAGNLHCHLVTTTPYDNLKIESFTVPNNVNTDSGDTENNMNIWLLGERYDTAQDNGYALFKWLKENTDIDAYYVIEKDCEDYHKIKNENNVLIFGSAKHFQISFKAGVLLGTHDLENLLPFKPAPGFYHYEDTIKVFLQHGVLGRKPAEYHKKYYDVPFDLFIVSSTPEKERIVINKMGYDEDEVAVTGLARFDNLPFNNTTKDILLMPTWRDWINSDEAFLKSKYYHRYMSLIQSPRLIKVLEDNNITLNFYPHYRAQKYFNSEYLNTNDRIRFITLGEQTVQDLLIKHSLLITDYSSVSFDFSLMNKPVIYYHFDVRRFFKNGKLRPIKETFIGDIAKQEDILIDLIEENIQNNFLNKYPDNSDIFDYQDHNNCKRIYNAVVNKINAAD